MRAQNERSFCARMIIIRRDQFSAKAERISQVSVPKN